MQEWRKIQTTKNKDPPASYHCHVLSHISFFTRRMMGELWIKNVQAASTVFAKEKYNSNTTSLQRQLVHYHSELHSGDFKGKPSQPTITTAFKAKVSIWVTEGTEYHKVCLQFFFFKDLRPYSVVEKGGFHQILTTLEYEIQSSQQSSPHCMQKPEQKWRMRWRNFRGYQVLCNYYCSLRHIDKNWYAQTNVLHTRSMCDSHTGAHMAEVPNAATEEHTEKEPAVFTAALLSPEVSCLFCVVTVVTFSLPSTLLFSFFL